MWAGQPIPGMGLGPLDRVLIPFSILWCGFAIFWETQVVRSHAPVLFQMWGIQFVAVGLYLLFGRFAWDAHVRAKTYYGITSKRVILVVKGNGRTVREFALHTLGQTTYRERPDKAGDIHLGPVPSLWSNNQNNFWPWMSQTLDSLQRVAHVRSVYDILMQARAKEQSPQS